MRSPAELTGLFRASGRKITPQRQCIFRILQGNQSHPTAETVFDAARAQMDSISLKTVYQTLNDLAEMGEILTLDLGTGSFRFDPNVVDHHHLVCGRCGVIRDIEVTVEPPALPEGSEQDFQVERAEITYRGLCPACRMRQNESMGGGRQNESMGGGRQNESTGGGQPNESTGGGQPRR